MGKLTFLSAIFLASFTSTAAADPLDRWASSTREAAARFGLPEDWIRNVMRAESGGATEVQGHAIVSSAGAMGLMQLMPGTWHDMRLLLGLGADPFDPRDNILAGSAYLRLMYDRFGYPGLFAAYNAGPARYAAVVASRRRLPIETRVYVRHVTQTESHLEATVRRRSSAVMLARPQASSASRLKPSDGSLFVPLSSAR